MNGSSSIRPATERRTKRTGSDRAIVGSAGAGWSVYLAVFSKPVVAVKSANERIFFDSARHGTPYKKDWLRSGNCGVSGCRLVGVFGRFLEAGRGGEVGQ